MIRVPAQRRGTMLEAAATALAQMLAPAFRAVLFKSVALAIVVLIALGVGIDRLLVGLLGHGLDWLTANLPTFAALPLRVLSFMLSVATGVGLLVTALFLVPAVTALVASLFADEIAEAVERTYYGADPVGMPLPRGRALIEAAKAALLTIAVYLCALPLMVVGGLGVFVFFVATAYLQGRIYFELAAMRFAPPAQAVELRRMHHGTVFLAGVFIAGFLSIPVVSLATPLFAMALMVHVHKYLTRRRPARLAMR
jgi:CysZ protein